MPHVIDIHDTHLTLFDGDTALLQSPGHAVISPRELLIGEPAAAEWRRNPRNSISGFWSRLSMDALPVTGHQARSWADLAWAQLDDLGKRASSAGIRMEEVIFAVPPGFSADQLAVLLGVAQQCPFRTVGLVDSIAAAWAGQGVGGDGGLALDFAFSGCTLLRVAVNDEQASATVLTEFADAGILALQNSWVALLADQFVNETRFDPLHDGTTEQFVYESLPGWLESLKHQNEADLEISHRGNTHRITLSRAAVAERSSVRLQAVAAALRSKAMPDEQLWLGHHAPQLPGADAAVGHAVAGQLDGRAVARGINANIERIVTSDSEAGLAWVSSLPMPASRAVPVASPTSPQPQPDVPRPAPTTTSRVPGEALAPSTIQPMPAPPDAPTHLLAGAQAWPLTHATLHVGSAGGSGRWATLPGLPRHLCDLEMVDGGVQLSNRHDAGTLVNGVCVTGRHMLRTGDSLASAETGVCLSAILVHPAESV